MPVRRDAAMSSNMADLSAQSRIECALDSHRNVASRDHNCLDVVGEAVIDVASAHEVDTIPSRHHHPNAGGPVYPRPSDPPCRPSDHSNGLIFPSLVSRTRPRNFQLDCCHHHDLSSQSH